MYYGIVFNIVMCNTFWGKSDTFTENHCLETTPFVTEQGKGYYKN